MPKRFIQWLVILIGLAGLGSGLSYMAMSQGWLKVGQLLFTGTALLSAFWFYGGLWAARSYRWIKVFASFAVTGGLCVLLVYWMLQTDHIAGAITLAGVWTMAAIFVLGLTLIRLLLVGPYPVVSVARTVIDEAIRMKVAMIFIVGMVLLVPLLPLMLDAKERLQYRIQTFLGMSLSGAALMLGLMTVFLACGTICNELRDKQIFMTMVKPITRFQYLLGKWVGISLLNLLLLGVAGGGIYVFAKTLQASRATSAADRMAVTEQIFVARRSIRPEMVSGKKFKELVDTRLKQLKLEDPERYDKNYGGKITSREFDDAGKQVVAGWHSISPGDSQTYVFRNLQVSRKFGDVVQLRFKPKAMKAPSDGMLNLALWVNDRPYPVRQGRHLPIRVADNNFHIIDLPLKLLNEKGELQVRIANVNLLQPRATYHSSINMTPGEGLSVLYRVGSFEANFLRALAILWIRLVFIAILGVSAGTFLTFPTACLLTLMIYVTAGASAFLGESLHYYAGLANTKMPLWDQLNVVAGKFFADLNDGKIWDACQIVIRLFGESFMLLVPSFAKYNPIPSVRDGLMVEYNLVGLAFLQVGVVWGGLCGLIGWTIFRFREIARIIV